MTISSSIPIGFSTSTGSYTSTSYSTSAGFYLSISSCTSAGFSTFVGFVSGFTPILLARLILNPFMFNA